MRLEGWNLVERMESGALFVMRMKHASMATTYEEVMCKGGTEQMILQRIDGHSRRFSVPWALRQQGNLLREIGTVFVKQGKVRNIYLLEFESNEQCLDDLVRLRTSRGCARRATVAAILTKSSANACTAETESAW